MLEEDSKENRMRDACRMLLALIVDKFKLGPVNEKIIQHILIGSCSEYMDSFKIHDTIAFALLTAESMYLSERFGINLKEEED